VRQTDWRDEKENIETLARKARQAAAPAFLAADPTGATLLMEAHFAAHEGQLANGPYLRVGLLKSAPARLYQRTELGLIDTHWKPGTIAVTLPHMTGESASSPLAMIGLAIDLDRIAHCEECGLRVDDLVEAAAFLHEDALIASVIMAMRHYADVHGCSGAFFDHGVALLLDRLAALRGTMRAAPRVAPLPARRLGRVIDLIEHRLSGDVTVAEMAAEAGRDSSGFTRAFKAATGMTPFAYLTLRRMERAKMLLCQGISVTHVALSVGYANPSKFAAAFRRICGQSPREWSVQPDQGPLIARVVAGL
jgi:AraC family transcriptional regulator